MRVTHFSGVETGFNQSIGNLFSDGWDFIELCKDLEQTYGVNLRLFFEDGQPAQRRGIWRNKIARDVTVRELADHIVELTTSP